MKLFQREQRSLFGEILDWMLTPLLLLWPISLVLTWFVAQSAAGKPFDQALEYNVGELAALVKVRDQQLDFTLPLPAHKLLRAAESDTVYYQIMGASGEFLSGERNLPLPPRDEGPFFSEVRIRDDDYHGDSIRVAYKWLAVDLPGARPVLVQVAEPLDKRAMLATEIVKGVMLQQFIILPLAVLLVWLGLAYAIKPLNQLEERIRARKPDDLSPLDDSSVPAGGRTAGVVGQRPAAAAQALDRTPEALSGRRRAPAQDPAGRTAHAGRPGAARRHERRRIQADAAPDRQCQRARDPHREPVAGAGARRRRQHGHDRASPATWPH